MSAAAEWLTPLPDAEQQRATDRWAIDERGIPGIELMERAGAGLAQAGTRAGAGADAWWSCAEGQQRR